MATTTFKRYSHPGDVPHLAISLKRFVETVENNYSTLDSPVFTGDPQAPTPPTPDNDTSIATTAFVKNQNYAPLASPVFTGNPQAPTPPLADNDTSIATTAFVKVQGYLTGNQTITLSGDISGSGATAITATLANVNANVGTFQGLTLDAKGRVTAAANQNYATTTALAGYLPLTAGTGVPLTGILKVDFNSGVASQTPLAGVMFWLDPPDGQTARFLFDTHGSVQALMSFRAARGTRAAPTASQLNDVLGAVNAFGYGATAYSAGGRAVIQFVAAENWSDTSQGTQIRFMTTPVGSTANAVVATIGAGIQVGAPTGGDLGAGTINAVQVYANGVLLTSDVNLKRDITPLPDALPLVAAIEPKSFYWLTPDPIPEGKDPTPKYSQQRGFLAQDVAAVMGGQTDHVDLGAMVAVLWKACQELTQRLEAIEAKK